MGSVIGSALGSIGGSAAGGNAPTLTATQLPGMGAAANQYSNLLTQNVNPYAQYAPQYQSVYNNQYNNPYAAGQQTAANTSGQQSTATGAQQYANSTALSGAANSLFPAIQNILTQSQDPQNALYNRTAQQTQDQSRVANAAAGTANSPYGAAVEGQNMNNFNIDWQNNALQRAMSGLSSAQSGIQGAGSAQNAAGNLGTAGAANTLQGGTTPYQTSMGQSQDQYAALSQLMQGLTGGNAINQQTMQEILPYLQMALNQSNTLTKDTNADAAAQQKSDSGFGSLLGGGIGALF